MALITARTLAERPHRGHVQTNGDPNQANQMSTASIQGEQALLRAGAAETVNLSLWESFILGAALSFLQLLATVVTNKDALIGIQAAISCLTELLAGTVTLN